jgi:hypothetical protein
MKAKHARQFVPEMAIEGMMMMSDAMVEATVQSAGDMGVSFLFQPVHRSTILTREHKVRSTLPCLL